MEYRWRTRAILLDPEEARAILDKTHKKWRSRVRGFKDQILKTHSVAINLYAQAMAEDSEQAMGVTDSGDVQFAQYSSNIICLDNDLNRLNENTRTVMKKIQNLGFACRLETVNAVEAGRGSLPGDGYRNVRRVLLHSLNLADLLPITSVWAGSPHSFRVTTVTDLLEQGVPLDTCSVSPAAPTRAPRACTTSPQAHHPQHREKISVSFGGRSTQFLGGNTCNSLHRLTSMYSVYLGT